MERILLSASFSLAFTILTHSLSLSLNDLKGECCLLYQSVLVFSPRLWLRKFTIFLYSLSFQNELNRKVATYRWSLSNFIGQWIKSFKLVPLLHYQQHRQTSKLLPVLIFRLALQSGIKQLFFCCCFFF